MGMTIKQLADQLGVSKTTISKAISALGLSNRLNRSGNKYIISEDQTEQIKMQIANSRPQTANDKSQTANDKSQTASDKSQTASDKSQTASDKSQTASDKSQTASDKSQLENQIALIELLQKQLVLLNEQLSIKDGQIKAYQEQIRILTDSLHDATVASQSKLIQKKKLLWIIKSSQIINKVYFQNYSGEKMVCKAPYSKFFQHSFFIKAEISFISLLS